MKLFRITVVSYVVMGWILNISFFVVVLLAGFSFTAKRWNARGGVFDPLPLPLDPVNDSGRGKVAIVTGGNAGLGFAVTKELFRVGYTVYIASRSLERGVTAKKKLLKQEDNGLGHLRVLQLDLSSFKSVRKFVDDFSKKEKRLDVLVLNAGIWANQVKTEDGISQTAQVNHYSGFLLTNLLLPKLIQQKGNVVVVSSAVYSKAIDFRCVLCNFCFPFTVFVCVETIQSFSIQSYLRFILYRQMPPFMGLPS